MKWIYQSKIRPTNGDINVTSDSAQAMAWYRENNKVRLQCIPCFCSNTLKTVKKN